MTKDNSKSEEQVDNEWLNDKVSEVLASLEGEETEKHILLPEDIDWEDPNS